MKYSKIIFDADNTLFDFDRAEEAALLNTLTDFGMPKPVGLIEFYRSMNVALWKQLEDKTISIAELKQHRAKKLFEFVGQSADVKEFSLHYLDELGQQHFLLPYVEETLNALSDHSEMAIITNGLARVQNPRFEKSSIKHHFDALVISEELGVAKPDPGIFAHTCDLMGWDDPKQVLMVGDNYTCDVQGAADFGMQTCWFNIRQQAHQLDNHHHEIHHFGELLQIINI